MALITFKPKLAGFVAAEQEFFLHEEEEELPTPRAVEFLRRINYGAWTYELSACQVEFRTKPCASVSDLMRNLVEGRREGNVVARQMGCILRCDEVASGNMPLDVYPSKRYLQLKKELPEETLRSACRVAAVHLHYGCRDMAHAIEVHRRIVPHLDRFIDLGDHSRGKRIQLYQDMASCWRPPVYDSEEHFWKVAVEQGFANNLKKCWHLIRISRHGTVELRMFGTTEDVEEIRQWAELVKRIAEA